MVIKSITGFPEPVESAPINDFPSLARDNHVLSTSEFATQL